MEGAGEDETFRARRRKLDAFLELLHIRRDSSGGPDIPQELSSRAFGLLAFRLGLSRTRRASKKDQGDGSRRLNEMPMFSQKNPQESHPYCPPTE